jgi:DNA polymerase II large subunit
MNSKDYFSDIEKNVKICYSLAEEAKKKGLDPVNKVEIPLATSLAEKVVGLISVVYPQLGKEVIDRILDLEKDYGKLDVAVSFKIAEEIAKEKFCKFNDLIEAIDAGIRVGFAYNTLGVVSSPIEGFTGLKLGKTRNNEDYFIASFSGPIRSAGTTASCVVLMLIDYLRELFGYAKYDPSEQEVKRYVTENYDYHERVSNLQYLPTEEEILFLAKNLPIQISGDATESREVSNYKDLPRVETNCIRGGMCLIFSEGLAQKAQKGLRLLKSVKEKGFKSSGWDFLDEYIIIHKKRVSGTGDVKANYMKDLVAGRPIFGHPSRSGTFRLRYGRSRVSGFSATSIHPASMAITDSFLSSGNQLKVEKPTKGCAITSCDSIDGPIVKLKNGSVRKLKDFEEAKKLYKETLEIIYLGDILYSFGDFINRNYELLKAGYVEEWWNLELEKAGGRVENPWKISFEGAKELSLKFGIPMHPEFIFYWSQIEYEDFLALLDWLSHSRYEEKLILPYNHQDCERFKKGKRAMEILGIPHEVVLEYAVLSKDYSRALLFNLGLEAVEGTLEDAVYDLIGKIKQGNVLETVNVLARAKIKDKAGTFIGARMGRPEKAKLRKLEGSPHVLFPVGDEGGRLRSVQEACEVGAVEGDFILNFCPNCQKETIYSKCEKCGVGVEARHYCSLCHTITNNVCEIHKKEQRFNNRKVDIKYYLSKAVSNLNLLKEEIPILVKGVRGTSSLEHIPEHLEKGILRASFGLNVNKDGTIRYDATELPITHFKPKEIGVSLEKLKSLGYDKDSFGDDMKNDEQIFELKPHDILLPSCPETKDERADDVFLNATKFIDSLLEKFYKIPKFYNLKNREDLVGHLVVCMAPHNCAGVIGRIIGFSKMQGLLASPYMHAAMRRDADGDEAAIMLLLDVLLNFSRKFLPSHRGGTQDAPLVLNAKIGAGEVDDQILDFEVGKYPLELYEMAEVGKHSSEMKLIETVRSRLKSGKDTFINIAFTHDTNDFNTGVINSSYKLIPTMQEKVQRMMDVAGKLRAVDAGDVAKLVIDRHFIRDIRGNLRKFSQQQFRCVKCNAKFRRPPLSGNCTKCSGKIIFTISEGSIIKYLEPALSLASNYKVSPYIKQSLELTKRFIESIFGKEKEKQAGLGSWF